MKCRSARRELRRRFEAPAFGSESPLEHGLELEAHLDSCARCREEAEAQGILLEALGELREPPVENVDVERSLARIRGSIATGPTPVGARPGRFGAWIAAAVALVALGAVLWSALGPSDELAPTAQPARIAERVPGDTGPTEVPSLAEAVPVPPAADEPPAETDGLDPERLAAARKQAQQALEAAHPTLDGLGAVAFAAAVDAGLAPLRAEDWPVERLVARFVDAEDRELARAALRYLGQRPTRSALSLLERALDGRDAAHAVRALADAGVEGRARLTRAVWQPGLSDVVLSCVLEDEIGGDELAGWAGAAFRAWRRQREHTHAVAERLVDELARRGRETARVLVELIDHPALEEVRVLDALARADAAQEVVAEVFSSDPPPLGEDVLLRLVERTRSRAALDWLEARARESRTRGPALRAAACVPGEGAARLLIEAWRGVDDGERELLATRAVAADAVRFTELARSWRAGDPSLDGAALLELLGLAEGGATVPAQLVLVSDSRLPGADRQLAALALVSDVTAAHRSSLEHALERVSSRDEGVAAALLMGLHRAAGGGAAGEAPVLALFDDEAAARDALELLTSDPEVLPPARVALRLAGLVKYLTSFRQSSRNAP